MTYKVKPTLTRFVTNSLFTPMDSTPATFFVRCMCVSVAYDNVFGVSVNRDNSKGDNVIGVEGESQGFLKSSHSC